MNPNLTLVYVLNVEFHGDWLDTDEFNAGTKVDWEIKELKAEGLITEDDYNEKKKDILDQF